MTAVVCIPFRDRGTDPLRQANLDTVLEWWSDTSWPVHVVDDGRTGDAQFNRSAAYNRGRTVAEQAGADVIVYAESDMLIAPEQITAAIEVATLTGIGLVVPFTSYRYLSETDSLILRGQSDTTTFEDLEKLPPESVMEDGRSIGAINVVSLATLAAVGQWDESFEGSWYDDTAMFRAFQVAAGTPRWVEGPAWHLHHLPGWAGDHLTDADRAATARNASRWELYRKANTAEAIRALTTGGE